jgi:hypothetical protein
MTRELKEAILGGCSDCGADGKGTGGLRGYMWKLAMEDKKNLRYGTMLSGWWVELVAVELQQFYEDFAAGRRPKLALMGSKEARAEPFAAQVQGGNVFLVAGSLAPRAARRDGVVPKRQVPRPGRRVCLLSEFGGRRGRAVCVF